MSYSDFFTLYSSHFTVLPGGTIQLATTAGNTSQGLGDGGGQTLPTLTMTNTPGGGAIVQYAQGQDGQFFVPGWFRKHTKHTPPITVQFSYPILGFVVLRPTLSILSIVCVRIVSMLTHLLNISFLSSSFSSLCYWRSASVRFASSHDNSRTQLDWCCRRQWNWTKPTGINSKIT